MSVELLALRGLNDVVVNDSEIAEGLKGAVWLVERYGVARSIFLQPVANLAALIAHVDQAVVAAVEGFNGETASAPKSELPKQTKNVLEKALRSETLKPQERETAAEAVQALMAALSETY